MTSIKEVLVRCAEELEESIENEGKLASFKQAAAMARSALAQLDSADARSGNLRRVVLDLLNGVTPAVENLACHQEQADADGCMVKVSRQALDEVLSAVNEVAVQAATSLSTGLLPNASPGNEKLGRFGHHPDPAIDFCIEVECIENEWSNIKANFTNGTPTRKEIEDRVFRAMQFRVGGDTGAVDAKAVLRKVEAEMRADASPGNGAEKL